MGTSSEGKFRLTIPSFANSHILASDGEPITSVYESTSDQEHELGTKLVYTDGRVFRYARNGGTALAKALMTTSQALNARSVDELQSTSGTSQEVGDQEIDIDVTTGGTWVENEYSGGYMVVNKATGIGDMYKIMAQKIDDSDDTLMRVLLETPLLTAFDATTEVTLVQSPWREVDVMPTTAEGTPAGIPLVTIPVNYFGWLQTGGYAPCYVDTGEALVKGEAVGFPGTPNVAGACGDTESVLDAIWGVAVYIGTAGEVAIIDLKLDA
jgi:hypothetical protein